MRQAKDLVAGLDDCLFSTAMDTCTGEEFYCNIELIIGDSWQLTTCDKFIDDYDLP